MNLEKKLNQSGQDRHDVFDAKNILNTNEARRASMLKELDLVKNEINHLFKSILVYQNDISDDSEYVDLPYLDHIKSLEKELESLSLKAEHIRSELTSLSLSDLELKNSINELRSNLAKFPEELLKIKPESRN